MGNCETCAKCEKCTTTKCTPCASNSFSSSQCIMTAIENAHSVNVRGETKDYNSKRRDKETSINTLKNAIIQLENQKKNNNNTKTNLKVQLNTNSVDYKDELEKCVSQSSNHTNTTTRCESNDRAPSLRDRNAMCAQTKGALVLRNSLQGRGWAQCKCPNGTLGDPHRICDSDEMYCSSCNEGYWKPPCNAFTRCFWDPDIVSITCNPWKECLPSEYETVSPHATRNRECATTRTCSAGEHETVAPTTTRDRECAWNQCTCPNGYPSVRSGCPLHELHHCSQCVNGYYLSSENRCNLNQCKCVNGTAATGTNCPGHEEYKCTSCDAGHKLGKIYGDIPSTNLFNTNSRHLFIRLLKFILLQI